MQSFQVQAPFQLSASQTKTVQQLFDGLKSNVKDQILLGATGTGKTFMVANVIERWGKPTLILAHNKTLAMQLYLELKEYFPQNRVEYFVSNFDFYQPEAYVPSKDLYIDKDVKHNLELDMMRLNTLNALSSRTDTIVVASVAAIYALQDPHEYQKSFFELKINQALSRQKIITYLIKSGYIRNDQVAKPGYFSAKGDLITIVTAYNNDHMIRLDLFDDTVEEIAIVHRISYQVLQRLNSITIFPAQDYVSSHERLTKALASIRSELKDRLNEFAATNKLLEQQRLAERTYYDLESLAEFGICSGIENYSRHLDLRTPGQPPYTLLDYFPKDFLLIVDESHMSIPQLRAMYNTDRSRKRNLVDYGFRLPSALDNRPLNFAEWEERVGQTIYTSATPGDYELERTDETNVIEQIIRPTGLLDPMVEVFPTDQQMLKIIYAIQTRAVKAERVLISTATIKMSEDLTAFLLEKNCKVAYLHSEIKTFTRTIILNDLRKGVYDCVVGVNLLREGIDLPEVSLICILDADKEGFLRNRRSLIQMMGRAARNENGTVYLFADKITKSIDYAMKETARRRKIQQEYNETHHIIPKTIHKDIFSYDLPDNQKRQINQLLRRSQKSGGAKITALIKQLEQKMYQASDKLDFEEAARLRDVILELRAKL